jgi:hypothetical protein
MSESGAKPNFSDPLYLQRLAAIAMDLRTIPYGQYEPLRQIKRRLCEVTGHEYRGKRYGGFEHTRRCQPDRWNPRKCLHCEYEEPHIEVTPHKFEMRFNAETPWFTKFQCEECLETMPAANKVIEHISTLTREEATKYLFEFARERKLSVKNTPVNE